MKEKRKGKRERRYDVGSRGNEIKKRKGRHKYKYKLRNISHKTVILTNRFM